MALAAAALHGRHVQLRGETQAYAEQHEQLLKPPRSEHHHPAPVALRPADRAQPGRLPATERAGLDRHNHALVQLSRLLGNEHARLRPQHATGAPGHRQEVHQLARHVPAKRRNRAGRGAHGGAHVGPLQDRVPAQVPVGQSGRLRRAPREARQIPASPQRDGREVLLRRFRSLKRPRSETVALLKVFLISSRAGGCEGKTAAIC